MEVKRKKNESIESLIRRFSRKVHMAGIDHELRKREFYLKPSEKKNRENQRAEFEHRKLVKKEKARRAAKRRGKRSRG